MARIAVNYALNQQVSQTLQKEHKVLDQMTVDLHTQLKKAVWVSESNATFQQILAKYNVHMAELHNELNRLGAALLSASERLKVADKKATNLF
jgi:uncharacterized protein YukE